MKIEVGQDWVFESKQMTMIDFKLEDACLKIEGHTPLSKNKCAELIKQFEDNLLVLRDIHSELEDF